MSEKLKLKISPAVACYVKPGTPLDTRLAGCEAASALQPSEQVTLLFCLSRDPEIPVKSAAVEKLKLLPQQVMDAYAGSSDGHPVILELLARIRNARPAVAAVPAPPPDSAAPPEAPEDAAAEPAAEDDEPVDTESEEFLSKYKMAQTMGIGEKIKMALTGDKEWRSILVKDANKLVSGGVIKNPRITDAEVLSLVKSGIQNDEIMRLICANREWIKNYNIRKALIANNRTPVQNSLKFLSTMGEKDLASFAKSKNVSSVVSTVAKRLLANMKK